MLPLRTCLVVTALVAAAVSVRASPNLTLEPCTLSGSLGVANIQARCGWLDRPENPDEPDSRHIRLRIAVIDALSPEAPSDALTVINGGPGASSIDLYADLAGAFARIHRERDIVVVDQRGTGASNPLNCPQLEDLSLDEETAPVEKATRACLADLAGDPRFYTTSVAVRDLEAVRTALGYQQLDVYGVSYGTRVAQHYARRYPDAVRTLIIDGVVPPDVPLGPNAALNAQRVLDRLFERCAQDTVCAARFPALPAELAALTEQLKSAPVPLEIAHPVTGRQVPVDLGYPHLVMTLRLLSYTPETASLLPLIIDEARTSANYVPLAANALRIEQELNGAIRFGMHNAVVCTEDLPFVSDVDLPALEATYMGASQFESLKTICAIWPEGLMDADLRTPLTGDVPTLVLSGEEDPITPPAYGERVAASLERSRALVAPGQGHGVVGRGCLPRVVADFVDTADPDRLDTECVERLGHEPFFVNLMGPVARPLRTDPGTDTP